MLDAIRPLPESESWGMRSGGLARLRSSAHLWPQEELSSFAPVWASETHVAGWHCLGQLAFFIHNYSPLHFLCMSAARLWSGSRGRHGSHTRHPAHNQSRQRLPETSYWVEGFFLAKNHIMRMLLVELNWYKLLFGLWFINSLLKMALCPMDFHLWVLQQLWALCKYHSTTKS